jgi:hypothetical protein
MSEPRIKAFRLWERESARGNHYFAGYLGAAAPQPRQPRRVQRRPKAEPTAADRPELNDDISDVGGEP